MAEAEKREYLLQLEMYVKQLVKDYENARREVEQCIYQIENAEAIKKNKELLYERGEIARADLLECETDRVKWETEKQVRICNAQILWFEIEVGIVLSQ